MELDFDTFLNEMNTADDNTIYNENFEEFLGTIYRMDNNVMQQQFNAIYGFNRDLDLNSLDSDLEYDDLLDTIADSDSEYDDLLETIEDLEQYAEPPPIEAF